VLYQLSYSRAIAIILAWGSDFTHLCPQPEFQYFRLFGFVSLLQKQGFKEDAILIRSPAKSSNDWFAEA
tara:strand:- start:189531 stop:189737 length:207 start_codon:yes stop_codon:yes gene_type:complete